jgi:hypothetical protein
MNSPQRAIQQFVADYKSKKNPPEKRWAVQSISVNFWCGDPRLTVTPGAKARPSCERAGPKNPGRTKARRYAKCKRWNSAILLIAADDWIPNGCYLQFSCASHEAVVGVKPP